ncbi:hypothetical protein THIOKS130001 [Thiocapsa sp. KS1]|nr:hypothetical protein THIOKS130001 [Thiocapsa sp. KS1]
MHISVRLAPSLAPTRSRRREALQHDFLLFGSPSSTAGNRREAAAPRDRRLAVVFFRWPDGQRGRAQLDERIPLRRFRFRFRCRSRLRQRQRLDSVLNLFLTRG